MNRQPFPHLLSALLSATARPLTRRRGVALLAALALLLFVPAAALAHVTTNDPSLPPATATYRIGADAIIEYYIPPGLAIDATGVTLSGFAGITHTDVGGGNEREQFLTLAAGNMSSGGPPGPFNAGGPVDFIAFNKVGNTTGTFNTEMLSLNLSGVGPFGPFLIRESPTLASPGQTTVTDLGGGQYRIDSFLDIFTEISLDGGASWSPSQGSTRFVAHDHPEPEAELTLAKTDDPDPVVAGGSLTYTLTLTNNGPDGATGILITDTLPGPFTFVSATPGAPTCNYNAGPHSVTCGLGSLASGASTNVVITGTVSSAWAGPFANFASASANELDADPSDNTNVMAATNVYGRLVFTSIRYEDGWVVERYPTAGTGGSYAVKTYTVPVGDDRYNRQVRGFVSFDTSALPDTAVVVSGTLRLVRANLLGASPFVSHGNLLVDILKGAFSGNNFLFSSDYNAASSLDSAATLSNPLNNGDPSTADLSGALAFVNPTGRTQFRLRFATEDDGDFVADQVLFHGALALDPANRPMLTIIYNLP